MSTAEPIRFLPPEAPEDNARADLYALVATLFYAPPDTELLASLAEADEIIGEGDSVPLADAWRGLQAACAAADEEAVQEEYDALLVGVGKAVVPLYLGAHAGSTGAESLLVELKAFLVERGLGRRSSVSEPEDHISALCEVMRHMISVQQAGIDEQRECFHRFIHVAGTRLCDAIVEADEANFYKSVARFAKSFFMLEHAAFEMH